MISKEVEADRVDSINRQDRREGIIIYEEHRTIRYKYNSGSRDRIARIVESRIGRIGRIIIVRIGDIR